MEGWQLPRVIGDVGEGQVMGGNRYERWGSRAWVLRCEGAIWVSAGYLRLIWRRHVRGGSLKRDAIFFEA